MADQGTIRDHSPIIERMLALVRDQGGFESGALGDRAETERIGYGQRSRPDDFVVLGEDTALELGSPEVPSVSRVLWTKRPDLLENRLWVLGEELLPGASRRLAFLQILCVAVDEGLDSHASALHRLKNLTNKIPGFMARSLPDRMWIRIRNDLMRKPFTLRALGQSLDRTYRESLPGVRSLEVILVAGHEEQIRAFEPLCAAARVISGENQKLHLAQEGIVCDELSCDACDEREACDTLRDIVGQKRNR